MSGRVETFRELAGCGMAWPVLLGDYTFFLKNFNFLKKSEFFSENPKIFRTFRKNFG